MASQVNSTNYFQDLMLILLKLFPKVTEERTLTNSFNEVTLLENQKKVSQKKKITGQLSVTDTDANILNKTLRNGFQQYIKRTIHHGQVGFIPAV